MAQAAKHHHVDLPLDELSLEQQVTSKLSQQVEHYKTDNQTLLTYSKFPPADNVSLQSNSWNTSSRSTI